MDIKFKDPDQNLIEDTKSFPFAIKMWRPNAIFLFGKKYFYNTNKNLSLFFHISIIWN
jgi:hypothetical protein